MTGCRLFRLAFAGSLLAIVGCGGGSVAIPEVVTPAQMYCTDGGNAAANTVNMTCGGATSDTTELVEVLVGGPLAGNTTVRGFSFDVTYDASRLEFVPATSYSSPLLPNALIAVTLFNGQQGRVVVSVQQPGNLNAVSIGPGQETLLDLSMRCLAGATFGPTPLTFENAETTGASSSIAFSGGIAMAFQ